MEILSEGVLVAALAAMADRAMLRNQFIAADAIGREMAVCKRGNLMQNVHMRSFQGAK